MIAPTPIDLKKGDKFVDLAAFTEKLHQFQNQCKQYYVKSGGRTLASYPLNGANLACVYRYVKYDCKYGKKRHVKKVTVRNAHTRKTKTIKCDCNSFIHLELDASKCNLEISEINTNHTGHDGSEEFYDLLPEMRRLDEDTLKIVHQYWTLKVPRTIIIDEVLRTKKIVMTRKDLDNVIRNFIDHNADNLEAAVQLLKHKYGCHVIYGIKKREGVNGKIIKEFESLYFSTDTMRKALISWPEIVFIDGTYKLLKRRLIVFVLAIQDSNRMTQIVGMGLLADEKKDTVKKFLQSFNQDHGNTCKKIKAFMSDKDLTERDVIKDLFPWVTLLLCEFHVLRIFSRTVSTSGMGITKTERKIALTYLYKLLKSGCKEQYLKLYNDFLTAVPAKVIEYFNKNWHPIRNQWTRYGQSECNLGNTTNNCVESTNARLKGEIDPYSTLCGFVIGFFRFYERRNRTIRFYLKDQYYKRSLHDFQPGSPEFEYQELLTATASRLVIKQLERRKPMSLYNVDKTLKTCWIQSGFIMVKASIDSCDCTEFTSYNLPCRHIFAIRNRFQQPLFSSDLCAERWTKAYDKMHQPMLMGLSLPQDKAVSTICNVVTKETVDEIKKLTAKQRQAIIFSLAKNLADVGAHVSGRKFQERVKLIELIMEVWIQGLEIDIATFISKCLPSLSNSDKHSSDKVIVLQPTFKTPSRAKHLSKCTIQRSKK